MVRSDTSLVILSKVWSRYSLHYNLKPGGHYCHHVSWHVYLGTFIPRYCSTEYGKQGSQHGSQQGLARALRPPSSTVAVATMSIAAAAATAAACGRMACRRAAWALRQPKYTPKHRRRRVDGGEPQGPTPAIQSWQLNHPMTLVLEYR
jgi:hypothetical protein